MKIGGMGFAFAIDEMQHANGTKHYSWILKRYNRVLGKGLADSKKEAEREAWTRFQEVSEVESKKTGAKALARVKLRQMLEKRPYLVAYTIEAIMGGVPINDLMKQAEVGERYWHEQDDPKFRVKLPTHGLAKSPWDGAKMIHDLFADLGYRDSNENWRIGMLTRWAKEYLGAAFIKDSQNYNEEAEDNADQE